MLADFQEGRRPRPNALASLLNTGHPHPLAHRPASGVVQHAHLAGPAARPGPRPLSAGQTLAVNAQNARVKRAVDQTVRACPQVIAETNAQVQRRVQSLAFSRYDFDKRQGGPDATATVIQVPGTYNQIDATRYAAGGLWIFVATLHEGYGDHVYYVLNPATGAMLEFKPEASRAPNQRSYFSKGARFRGIAAATGVAGGYLEKLFAGTATAFATGGVAAEAGALGWAVEQGVPLVSRVAVRVWQVGAPLARAAGQRAAEGFWARVGTDLGIQLTGGFVTGHGTVLQRGEQAASGVNGTSLLLAGVVNTGELQLSKLAKWLVAGGTAAGSNLVTASKDNRKKYGGFVHVVDFHDSQQVDGFAFSVVLGMLLDRGREVIAERGTERLVETAAHASGQAQRAALRWISANRVSLGLNLSLGAAFESDKKTIEHLWDDRNEEVKKEEEAHLTRTRMPVRPTPPTPKR